MILSHFTLNGRYPSTRQCLSNAHDMHRNVMSGFADLRSNCPRREQSVLYRLMPNGNRIHLYVLSKEYPEWSNISEGFMLLQEPKDISDIIDTLRNGRHLSFDLLAIASKKEAREGMNSRRIMLATEEERIDWLSKKAEQNGFNTLWVREDGQEKAFVRGKPGCSDAVHTGVRFRGELIVSEETLFQKAFCTGIGPGKAYGMGMLMVMSPRRE